ncbi:MAG: hypothetical protein LC676_07665 [Loktanella sp.]|nr:hypothetical protein [Loktanella sp.]
MTPEAAAFYAEQVTLNSLVQNLLYASGTVGAILVVVGLLLIDAGTSRRKNLFNSTMPFTSPAWWPRSPRRFSAMPHGDRSGR